MSQYTRKYGPSPAFQWTNAEISDDNLINVSWESEDFTSKKYLPFNFTRIINQGEDNIIFYPNQDTSNPFLIVKGTQQTIDRSSLPAVSSFAIKRSGTNTITASKIVVVNSKEAETETSMLQRLHRRLLDKQNRSVI